MSQNPKEFPNVGNKLSAPSKKSIFERQKAEAEAKRLKEEEETAAVYADFVKSFDNEDDDDQGGGVFASGPSRPSPGPGRFPPSGGPGKRHFTTPSSKPGFGGGPRASGPGSLGPPPSAFSRKRTFDGAPARDAGFRKGRHGYGEPDDVKTQAFVDSDDEETKDIKMKDAERAVSKPTIHLSSLPLVLSPPAIKSLLPQALKVESLRMIPQAASASTDRKSASAIVTLAADTPASEIDSAVSALQNKYLGWGFHLNISRHLSSAAITGASIPGITGATTLPFGAKLAPQGPAPSLSRAPPPPGMGRGFAPPASYGPSPGLGRGNAPAQVEVKPPSDLKQLKLIHKTVESVISHGAEFEALLMSRPSVQKDEVWAWLWDPRSQGGVYYRWRLWDMLTNAQQRIRKGSGKNDNSTQIVFLGGAPWASQERALAFEYNSNLAEFVSDSEYDSSEDEDSGDEGRRRLQHLQGASMPNDQAESDLPSYLNPLQKAKLVHLLARLPTSTARLRRGDIARITAFAIKHASEGADEVVSLIIQNVHHPLSLTSANPEHRAQLKSRSGSPDTNKDTMQTPDIDHSSITLVALYAISDILSSSSTSGVRHAWRYRQLFEASLQKRNTFAHLGRLEKTLGWGRMRAEKFKRSVNSLLALWEGWCVFPVPAQEEFGRVFNEPPLTEKEKRDIEAREREEEREKGKKGGSKWRTVEEGKEKGGVGGKGGEGEDVVMDDVDGEPMVDDDDEDLDGEPMVDDEDVDGEPMVEDDEESTKTGAGGSVDAASELKAPVDSTMKEAEPPKTTRLRRPKAEDMFADSDDE